MWGIHIENATMIYTLTPKSNFAEPVHPPAYFWEETGKPTGNSHGHRKNMQNSVDKNPSSGSNLGPWRLQHFLLHHLECSIT